MVSVNEGRFLTVAVVVLTMLSASVILVAYGTGDSEAAPATEWYSYGHHLEFRDRSYNPSTYASIEWRYSEEPLSDSDLGVQLTSDPSDGYSATLDLDIREYPYWSLTPLFVRETATMVSGEVRSAEFVVNVNPIPDVSHVLFMYDDTHGYRYQSVSRTTSIAVGTDPIVELPLDPSRDGYTFGGWYSDTACTVPFDNMGPAVFSSDADIVVYPKWIWTGTPGGDPSVVTHFIMLQPVDGIDLEYGSMAVQRGSGFSFTASVMDGFRFDISEMKAVTNTGKVLPYTDNPDGSRTFTLSRVTADMTIMLTDYRQYFKVTTVFDNVSTVGFEQWVPQGTPLTLPLTSTVGGDVEATVFIGTSDVTGNTYSNGTVNIPSVTGDVYVYASSVQRSASDLPWEVIAIIAIATAAILAVVMVVRHVRARDRG